MARSNEPAISKWHARVKLRTIGLIIVARSRVQLELRFSEMFLKACSVYFRISRIKLKKRVFGFHVSGEFRGVLANSINSRMRRTPRGKQKNSFL